VRLRKVDGKAERLDAAPIQLRLQARDLAELGGADGREIFRVAEEQAQERPSQS
jgi:hypothetical protein